ncbi:MAG: ABC transporter substrate-binding protein [Gammaproteobacteria bacterium]|nr:MAG: ABC transporter substrate-binding protein [Gammaproteobacteria bacterium]
MVRGLCPGRWWCLLLPFLLFGCSHPDHRAIRLGIANRVITLDPRYATDAVSARIDRLLYQRLVDFDAHQQPVPALARWQRLSPTHYRFRLVEPRPRFDDGHRLDAEDVRATYANVLDPATASPHRGSLRLVRAIEVRDSRTVDFYLSRPDPLFPGVLTLGILPARGLAEGRDFNLHPEGTGPFRLLARADAARVVLERRRDGQRFEILSVRDATVRVLKLLRGELDLVQNDLPAELVAWLAHRREVRLLRHPGSNFAYIGFNLQDPVTGDRRVRLAVAKAIDRRAIVRYLLAGHARLAGGLLPPEHWAGHPGLQGIAYDPEGARRLLAALGHSPAHPLRLVYKTSNNAQRLRIATVLRDYLERVGFDVKIRSYDWGTFYGDIKAGRFQMYTLAWVGIKSPDIFRYVFHSASVPPAGANRGRYRNPEVDRLIEAAATAASFRERQRLYRRIQEILLEDLPYVPLWFEDQVAVVRRDIHGYRLATDGNYDALAEVYRR